MAVSATASATATMMYPERDGKPRGETDIHIDAMIYLREALKHYFRQTPQVYVAGNLLIYYEENNPSASIAPDVFVVPGVHQHQRRTYKLWEEGPPPAVVFEVTSRSSRLEDTGTKRAVYAMLGVQEYFVYDPLGEYLRPALQGYRLQEGDYQRVQPASAGHLVSQVLGLEMRLEDGRLRLVDPTTGERLLTHEEAQEARQIAQDRAAQAEDRAAQAEDRAAQAEDRAAQEVAARQEAEAELHRLRTELARRQREV